MMDRSMIDAASGGALVDKTQATIRHLISNMAKNIQQFGIRGASQYRMVNEIGVVDNLRLENQLIELTSLVRQLVVGQHQPSVAARAYGICTSVENPTDMSPTLQETESDYPKSVRVVGGYQYGKQPYQRSSQGPCVSQRFGPTLNVPQGLAGHRQPTKQYQTPPFQQQPQQRIPAQGHSPSLEDLMKQLATSNLEFQQTMSSSNMQFYQSMNTIIQDLKMQIGKLANTMSQLQSVRSSNLPSQTIPNPRGNKTVPLPFPTLQVSAKKLDSDEELLRMFRNVEINIPLLDAIKQIPKYAKFLKELCIHKKKKMKGSVEVGGIVSALTRNEDITIGAQARSQNFLYHMYHWRLYLCRCHIELGSFN
ncbi:hypothetical protein CR513_21172, partial [Mucuna pruriens]